MDWSERNESSKSLFVEEKQDLSRRLHLEIETAETEAVSFLFFKFCTYVRINDFLQCIF